MKLLFVSHESGLGGGTRSMLALIDQLLPHHQISVLIKRSSGPLYNELRQRPVQIIVHPFFQWFRLPKPPLISALEHLESYCNPLLALLLLPRIRREGFEVIHSNSSVVNIGALLARWLHIPHVWHIREFAEEDFHFRCVSPSKRYSMIAQSDAVIVISQALYRKYQPHIPEDKLHVIYNGVSEQYCIDKVEPPTLPLRFLITGRIEQAKGQEQAITAAALLRQRGITAFHIDLAGQGAPEDEAILRAQVVQSGLQDTVTFLGQVHNMRAQRTQEDVEIVCSRSEAFGRVTVEAMFACNPVIASRAGANPELIQDGETGLLYEYGDAQDLARCMESLIADPARIRQMGRLAQQRALAQFTAKKNAEQIEQLYKTLS